jgi:drug/metabolite transporter (DMT)-like permease
MKTLKSIIEFVVNMMDTSLRGMLLLGVIVISPTIFIALMAPLTPPHIRFWGIFGLIVIGSYIVGRTLNNNKHGDKQ